MNIYEKAGLVAVGFNEYGEALFLGTLAQWESYALLKQGDEIEEQLQVKEKENL